MDEDVDLSLALLPHLWTRSGLVRTRVVLVVELLGACVPLGRATQIKLKSSGGRTAP